MIRRTVLILAMTVGLTGFGHSQNQAKQVGTARILGTAVHADGTSVLCVEIEPVNADNPSAVASVSSTDGSFTTAKLPRGRYRVGVDLGINRQPDEAYGRTYFPGTPDRSKAIELEIAPGLPEPRILFTVPNRRPSVEMRGTVVYEDGKPAPGVDVFFSPVGGYSTAQMWADAKGNYVATKYGAVAYRIRSTSRDSKYESQVQVVQAADLEAPTLLVLRQVASPQPKLPQ
jgi:hypothetical protein